MYTGYANDVYVELCCDNTVWKKVIHCDLFCQNLSLSLFMGVYSQKLSCLLSLSFHLAVAEKKKKKLLPVVVREEGWVSFCSFLSSTEL